MKSSIRSIDDEKPTPEELAQIEEGVCINCLKHNTTEEPILFVSLTSGGLLWWHDRHCAATDRHYPKNRES